MFACHCDLLSEVAVSEKSRLENMIRSRAWAAIGDPSNVNCKGGRHAVNSLRNGFEGQTCELDRKESEEIGSASPEMRPFTLLLNHQHVFP
jgi:hypothetical protein